MPGESIRQGVFLPTTVNFELGLLQDVDLNSPQFRELLVRLYQYVNQISLVVNQKTSCYFDTTAFVDGNLFFPNPNTPVANTPIYRNEIRKVIQLPDGLPNTTTIMIAHGIPVTTAWTWVGAYGAATDTSNGYGYFIPNNGVTVYVDNTYVYITTSSDLSAYNYGLIVLMYLVQ